MTQQFLLLFFHGVAQQTLETILLVAYEQLNTKVSPSRLTIIIRGKMKCLVVAGEIVVVE